MKKYTWKEAIYKVMAENGGEMTANEISDAILLAKLKSQRPLPPRQLARIYTFQLKSLGINPLSNK